MLYDNELTKLYALSKTLRFELKPVGKTPDLLLANRIVERDKVRDDNYHKVKYYLDLMHRKFIDDALSNIRLDYTEFYAEFLKLSSNTSKDSKSKTKNSFDLLRNEFIESFNETANKWKERFNRKWTSSSSGQGKKTKDIQLKKDGINILFEENNLCILKDMFTDIVDKNGNAPDIIYKKPKTNDEINIFDSFKGFHTYFANYNKSRENLYSNKAQTTAIANRAINENLVKFCENIRSFNKNKEKYIEAGLTEDEKTIFEITNYNNFIKQSGIDNYNQTIAELNKKVNLYRQKTKDKSLSYFKTLYNQILSEKSKETSLIEISDDDSVFKVINDFIVINDAKIQTANSLISSLVTNNDEYDLSKIYISGKSTINTISNRWFKNWNTLEHQLNQLKSKDQPEIKNFSLALIKEAFDEISATESPNYIIASDLFKDEYLGLNKGSYFELFLNIIKIEFERNQKEYENCRTNLEKLIEQDKYYRKDVNQIVKIKQYSDAALSIYQFIKYFKLKDTKDEKNTNNQFETDASFYNKLDNYIEDYPIITYYNELRNYITKKDYLTRLKFPSVSGKREYKDIRSKPKIDGAEKIKINFDKGTLLGGWAESPTGNAQYNGYLLRKNGIYYLAISDSTTILDVTKHKEVGNIESGYFEKMNYKQLKSQTLYGSSYESIYKTQYKTDKEKLKPEELINRVKTILKNQVDLYPELTVVLENHYDDPKELAKDLNNITLYSVTFTEKVSSEYIEKASYLFDKAKDPKSLYLFEIYSKDFSEFAAGKTNLHTEYFKHLFSDINLKSPTIKLSGGAEIFFRPLNDTLSTEPTPRATGTNRITKPIIKNKRYTQDKWFLHIPIVLNMGKNKYERSKPFNLLFNQKLQKTEGVNVIGIDRGEKHLAYYCVINPKGVIIESESLNIISQFDRDGKEIKSFNYLEALEAKAGKRGDARENWQTIENIKELKKGYISNIVKKIADKMIEHNAILVLEDLNKGFKRGRIKIEKQVYQHLELALSKKLNYIVDKTAKESQPGYTLNALQLTPLTTNYKDIYSQNGSIFYTVASYTSKTCPDCGFRPTIYEKYQNETKAKSFLEKFDDIYFDTTKNSIKFKYSPIKFADNSKKELPLDIKTEVISNVLRYVGYKDDRGLWQTKEIDVNLELNRLLEKYNIYKTKNIKNQILTNSNIDKTFYEKFIWIVKLIMQIRNSYKDGDTEKDIISCPSCGFHSDNPPARLHTLKNGDANGAYNIARKGLLILNKIKNTQDLEKLTFKDITVDINTWDKFVRSNYTK